MTLAIRAYRVRAAHRAVVLFLKIGSAPTIPGLGGGEGGSRNIMSLRGDNGGLQRNRRSDRAHGRRGTYDLRRNNPPSPLRCP